MIRTTNLKIPRNNDNESYLRTRLAKQLRCKLEDIRNIEIVKKSLDARKKFDIFWVYTLDVEVKNEDLVLKRGKNVRKLKKETLSQLPKYAYKTRPIIVGSGPSGLFLALVLARANARPIIIERGENVEGRMKSIQEFFKTGKLNEDSNVQFGEGGAGTFSDGKLNTSIKDFRNKYVLKEFIKAGADPSIIYMNKPHIGTDKLIEILKNIRGEIISLGGEFRFLENLENIELKEGYKELTINSKDKRYTLNTEILVLALGNASRKTFRMLSKVGISLEPKPFAVGLRIQHPQEWINKAMYGESEPKDLPTADYKLTYRSTSGRSVYSFCMCPGGYVVNSSSENGYMVVNGMSYSKRNSQNANSAIVVGVDFKTDDIFAGMKFQEKIEKTSYDVGGGKIPTSTFEAYKSNTDKIRLGRVQPQFKGDYILTNIRNILPKEIENSIIEAIDVFGQKIEGFNASDCLLSAVESRTSSPIRIFRNDLYESNIEKIYPIGEGAGYAGGIMSAAIDGIRVAEKILENGNEG